jgi:hypothetical protein
MSDKTLEDLVREAQEAWEAASVVCAWSDMGICWYIELSDGKSKYISGANKIVFLGKTPEDACLEAIKAAPMLSSEQLYKNGIALAGKP